MSRASAKRAAFGTTPEGETVAVHTLTNGRGMEVRVLELGGFVLSIRTPDRHGVIDDVTVGYATLDDYRSDRRFAGALVGRCANRIARGQFSLDGRRYELEANDGPHHLHGGPGGFHTVVWRGESFARDGEAGVVLSHTSPDGAGGYPGTLAVRVTVTLDADNALRFDAEATTDRATPVNITQHSYFNLSGQGHVREIVDHELALRAAHYTPVDATLIPTGEVRPVRGTPFDFTTAMAIGARIDAGDEQLGFGRGYDHNFVLDADAAGACRPAATLYDPHSGRSLEILTTAPGLQFYSGNVLDYGDASGPVVRNRCALALEAQHFPDAPNQPAFPSTIVRPGDVYASRIVYRFAAGGRPAC